MQKLSILLGVMLFTFFSVKAQKIEGELKKWHKVTLTFEGDELSENDEVNPFLNYRLNVTFKNKNKTMIVPGFYAADGNAAETSAKSGNVWKVRFMPDEVGEWSYEVSFRKGENIAVSDDIFEGDGVGFDGTKGTFTISEGDTSGSRFRTKGRLQYKGNRYLRYADTNEPFLKGGADSPENFLGYYEFDQTPASHKFEPHAKDWKQGDPSWQNGKGKNIIGALNYLASKGMNSVYFLTMNIQADGKDVWPWNNRHERYRFDCSKLDQWEVVFDHMDDLGLMLHFVTQETENETLLDMGETKTQRKLYYRELIARFAHHLGITWNLGEENAPIIWSPKGQTVKDIKDMSKYLRLHDPYNNYISLHTHAQTREQTHALIPQLDNPYLDGPSMQTHHPHDVHDITLKWINESANFGRQWVVTQDEIGPADKGAIPDADDPHHDHIRHHVLWGNLMAGGAGVEWYFGYKHAHNDLNCEDWRSRDILWDQTRYGIEFFSKYVKNFDEMYSANNLTDNEKDYVFAKEGQTYVVYLPEVKPTKLNLINAATKFTVKWYNPRTGGALKTGSVKSVKGGKMVSIGNPPSNEKDWVALVTTAKPVKVNEPLRKVVSTISDFEIENSADASYYIDKKYNAFAINAAKKDQRDVEAKATMIFKGNNGKYAGIIQTIAENDGESVYSIYVNGHKMKTVVNPSTNKSFYNVSLSLGNIYLNTNDTITISSKAKTNKKIAENNETAWSRGRWTGVVFTEVKYDLDRKLADVKAFEEKNGFLAVEAEDFHDNTNNLSPRKWYVRSPKEYQTFKLRDVHYNSASKYAYIEAMPDNRITHNDKLIQGENFFPQPGTGGVVSYKVKITNPGTYYVWVRAYSQGSEDNGLHVGVNGEWPESGQRIQLCKGKHKWTWSSAQRVPENHCGFMQTITLTFDKADEYIISFSMREDGFEFDKWVLAKDKNYVP